MAIILERIRIQNFKSFDNYCVEFNSSNLVVFDGPNGFGKTSFYDAIELLFTGNLRRYSDLVEKVVDKRQSSLGSPLLNDRGEGDLIIKVQLDVNGEKIYIVRLGTREDLLSEKNTEVPKLKLYRIDQFDSDNYILVEDEESYLTGLLGKNYTENFEFLNYIEQEENIHLLKNKDKGRKDAISHLFNTVEFGQRISKLTESSKRIGDLCGAKPKGALEKLKIELDAYQSKLSGVNTPVIFRKMITWKSIGWDVEKLDFPDEQYLNWLTEGGEFDMLQNFISNFDDFKKDRENKLLDSLLVDEGLVSEYLLCWRFIERVDEFNKKLLTKKSIDDLLQNYEQGIVEAIKYNKLYLTDEIQEIVKSIIDVNSYPEQLVDIQNIHNNADTLSRILIDIKESRETFIDKYLKYEEEVSQDNNCPLCGYSWKDADELKANFETQAEQIEQLLEKSGTELNYKIENLIKKYILPIKKHLKDFLLNNPVNEVFVNKLKRASINYENLKVLSKQFEVLDIKMLHLLNDNPLTVENIKLAELRLIIDDKKHVVNLEKVQPYFGTIFLQIFDESYKNVFSINETDILNKRKYIEWQYSLHQSVIIKKLEKEYADLDNQFKKAKLAKKKIDSLKKIYVSSLTSYQKSLIENIEILFHIYSGRISQEGKGSLGLFIDPDSNGIRFLENHSKQHDAIFTMSSGQLATLVISFTLALNKRYSQNKMLFIDDPIQTLDELNVAGLIELLRNDFSDRQIFISTHEDVMSTYMRYKFKKFGLGAQRINFKESQLAVSS